MRMGECPSTQTLEASEATMQWSQVLASVRAGERRVLVEENGIPVAAIVSADDLAQLKRFEADRDRRFAALDRIGEAFKDVPVEELESEVAKALAVVRERKRKQTASGL